MCTRFSLVTKILELQAQFNTYNLIEGLTTKETFLPTDRILTISRNLKTQKNEMKLMRWGLIPNSIRDFEQVKKYSMFNARAESLEEKPSFRNLLESNRCLIPADVFYEYKQEGKKKDKYAFTLNPESTFAMAGLWDKWINPNTKEEVISCTIITTVGNEIVKPIHEKNRMPVILENESYTRWLSPEIRFSECKELLKSYSTDKMKAGKIIQEDNRNLAQRIRIQSQVEGNQDNTQPSPFRSK